jgi:hypothetical protein
MDMLQDPQYKTEDGAALRIWRDSLQNNFLTEREGRPIFDEVILCEVIAPGSRDSTPVFEVERKYHELMGIADAAQGAKYAAFRQYIEDFKRGETTDASLAGTPLTQWPELNRSLVATLRAADVYTVEALANLPDTKLTIVGPDGRTWRAKAAAYITNAKNGAYATELAARVEALATQLADEQSRSAALASRVQELETAAANGQPAPAAGRKAAKPPEAQPQPAPVPRPTPTRRTPSRATATR